MKNIFNGPSERRGGLFLPRARQASNTYGNYMQRVIDFRRDCSRAVKSEHLLIKLLSALSMDITGSIQEYAWTQGDNLVAVCSNLGMTSPWTHGKLHRGVLFNGLDEILLYATEDHSIDTLQMAYESWEDLAPIQVIQHPYSNVDLPWLDGVERAIPGVQGFAMTIIDPVLLAVQWRGFVENVIQKATDSPPGMNLFLQRYPLANALYSYTDITYFNRLSSMLMGMDAPSIHVSNPQYKSIPVDLIDQTLGKAGEAMMSRAMTFDDWLSAVPLYTESDYHQYIRADSLSYSSSMEWASFIMMLPAIRLCLDLNATSGYARNYLYTNQIKHWLTRIQNGSILNTSTLKGLPASRLTNVIDMDVRPLL